MTAWPLARPLGARRSIAIPPPLSGVHCRHRFFCPTLAPPTIGALRRGRGRSGSREGSPPKRPIPMMATGRGIRMGTLDGVRAPARGMPDGVVGTRLGISLLALLALFLLAGPT